MSNPQVYTPQLVINGWVQLVGSAERDIRKEIERQMEEEDLGAVAIDRITRTGNSLRVDLHAKRNANTNLVVTLFENGITTDVARGENANRKLTNDAIVRWQSTTNENTVTIPLDPSWRADHLGVAAFLQDGKTLEIFTSDVRRVGATGSDS